MIGTTSGSDSESDLSEEVNTERNEEVSEAASDIANEVVSDVTSEAVDNVTSGESRETQRSIRMCSLCGYWADYSLWTQACQCSRSHRGCLQRYTMRSLLKSPGCPVKCPLCHCIYKCEPQQGLALSILGAMYTRYLYVDSLMLTGLTVIGLHVATVTAGLFSLRLVLGHQEVENLLQTGDPMDVFNMCLWIPYSSFFIAAMPWEHALLTFLHKMSRLPLLCRVLPEECSDVQIRWHLASFWDIPISAIFLVVCSKFVGEMFFDSVKSQVNRFIIGGATFLAFKGILRMYYKQKLYVRKSRLMINNFRPE